MIDEKCLAERDALLLRAIQNKLLPMKASREIEESPIGSPEAEGRGVVDQAKREQAAIGIAVPAVHRAAQSKPPKLAGGNTEPRIPLQMRADAFALAAASSDGSARTARCERNVERIAPAVLCLHKTGAMPP